MLGCGETTLRGYVDTGQLHLVHHGTRSVLAVAEICELATRLASEAGVETDPAVALKAFGDYSGDLPPVRSA
jgi:hypothetical protein